MLFRSVVVSAPEHTARKSYAPHKSTPQKTDEKPRWAGWGCISLVIGAGRLVDHPLAGPAVARCLSLPPPSRLTQKNLGLKNRATGTAKWPAENFFFLGEKADPGKSMRNAPKGGEIQVLGPFLGPNWVRFINEIGAKMSAKTVAKKARKPRQKSGRNSRNFAAKTGRNKCPKTGRESGIRN